MKCDYCGQEIPLGSGVVDNSKNFCSSLHKYSYQQESYSKQAEPKTRSNRTVSQTIIPFKKRTNIIAGIVLIIVCASYLIAKYRIESTPVVIQARQMADAMLKSDFDRFIDYTFPKVVQLFGGKEKMAKFLKNGVVNMHEHGYQYLSCEVGKPEEIRKVDNYSFTIIPETIKMRTEKGTLVQESYFLGISTDDGNNWKFIDGAGIKDTSILRIVIPELVGQIEIRQLKKPTLIP
jgi:hypothetical protein